MVVFTVRHKFFRISTSKTKQGRFILYTLRYSKKKITTAEKLSNYRTYNRKRHRSSFAFPRDALIKLKNVLGKRAHLLEIRLQNRGPNYKQEMCTLIHKVNTNKTVRGRSKAHTYVYRHRVPYAHSREQYMKDAQTVSIQSIFVQVFTLNNKKGRKNRIGQRSASLLFAVLYIYNTCRRRVGGRVRKLILDIGKVARRGTNVKNKYL